MNECVSIIVPVYNVEAYLEQCVESIKNQTYKNLEIILIDDGSKDTSGEIADRLCTTDNRIKVIHQQNKGMSSARNYGLDICKGDYICFIDSDDYIRDNFVEELLQACIINSVDMAMCFSFSIKDNKEILSNIKKETEILSSKEMCLRYMDPQYEVVWNKIFKRNILNDIRFPLGRIHEDAAVAYKMIWKATKVALIHEELYGYRVNYSGIMRSKYTSKRYDEITAVKEAIVFFVK